MAIFVGEPTGGNPGGATAGIIFFVKLPNSGIKVRVPVQRTVRFSARAANITAMPSG